MKGEFWWIMNATVLHSDFSQDSKNCMMHQIIQKDRSHKRGSLLQKILTRDMHCTSPRIAIIDRPRDGQVFRVIYPPGPTSVHYCEVYRNLTRKVRLGWEVLTCQNLAAPVPSINRFIDHSPQPGRQNRHTFHRYFLQYERQCSTLNWGKLECWFSLSWLKTGNLFYYTFQLLWKKLTKSQRTIAILYTDGGKRIVCNFSRTAI